MKKTADSKKKQSGFIVSAELILIATILVIGLLVGWVKLRNAVLAELWDVSEAIGRINQSYTYNGVAISSGNSSYVWTAGGNYVDNPDRSIPSPAFGVAGLMMDQNGILVQSTDREDGR